MKNIRVLVLGAGAVGGYFGGRLAQGGCDVAFMVRAGRQNIIENSGLQIESPMGNVNLPIKTILSQDAKPEYDYILMTPKAYDLEDSLNSIQSAISDKTIIIPVLNGMAHIDRLNELFGRNRVLGGVVVIQAALLPSGVIKHFNNDAVIMIGEQDHNQPKIAQPFIGLFQNAIGVRARAVNDIKRRMWAKWVRLSALAGMTCLMRANVGEINRAPGGHSAIKRFLSANLKIASHYGYELTDDDASGVGDFLFGENSTTTASMLRDIEYGGRIESEQILGDLLRRAKIANVDHPILELAYINARAYEERMKSGRDHQNQTRLS